MDRAGWPYSSQRGCEVRTSVSTWFRNCSTVRRPSRPDRTCGIERAEGFCIPLGSETVDVACAFSVFTHLRHEESYAYMQDCRRVLKSGGTLVFSFLEYRVPSHWDVMEANLDTVGDVGVLNQFMSTDAVEVWAQHLEVDLIAVCRGDDEFIPLARPIELAGHRYEDLGTFGQSVAVYRKPRGV